MALSVLSLRDGAIRLDYWIDMARGSMDVSLVLLARFHEKTFLLSVLYISMQVCMAGRTELLVHGEMHESSGAYFSKD